MDIPRPSQAKAQLRRRVFVGAGIILGLAAITIGFRSLKPAPPSIDRSLVWIDTVKEGPLLRQVRGLGTLIPEDVRMITARTAGRVEKIVLRPGALVQADSIILELNNPEVIQAADTAASQYKATEAELTNLKIRLQSDELAMEAALARAKSEFETSRLQAEVDEALFKDGLVSALELKKAKVGAEDATTRYEIEKKRYAFTLESSRLQTSVKIAELERVASVSRLRNEDLEALHVRAGMVGVLQTLNLDVGQQCASGGLLARVADPSRLRAEIRIQETQARDIQAGQAAQIDTRNGLVPGRVNRVDPSVQNGTVTVEISLPSTLPKGARPDLTVDGSIELERLDKVLHVGRPANAREHASFSMLVVSPDGSEALRRSVSLGSGSSSSIQVLSGLVPGDRVILSDMSQFENTDRIRLR